MLVYVAPVTPSTCIFEALVTLLPNWPSADAIPCDEQALALGSVAVDVLTGVRRFKATFKLSMKADIGVLHVAPATAECTVTLAGVEPAMPDLLAVTHASNIVWTATKGDDKTWYAADSDKLVVSAAAPVVAA